jgi:hypothetical protein
MARRSPCPTRGKINEHIRRADFRKGVRLGKDDHIVWWRGRWLRNALAKRLFFHTANNELSLRPAINLKVFDFNRVLTSMN